MFGDQDDQSADDQSGRHDFDREKIGRDDVLEQEAEQGGREERDQDRGGEGDGLAVATAKTRQHATHTSEERHEHGENRAELDDDDVIVGDTFHRDRATFAVGYARHGDIGELRHAEQAVTEDHMTGRAYRQIFRDAFDRAGDDGACIREIAADFLGGHRRSIPGERGQGRQQPQTEGETKHGRPLGSRPFWGKESRQKPLSLALSAGSRFMQASPCRPPASSRPPNLASACRTPAAVSVSSAECMSRRR